MSSDQSVNLAVAFVPWMCEVTNRPMSCVAAAELIVVVPTCVHSVPLREHETMNFLPYFSTFSHVGWLLVPQPLSTGSSALLTWPLPPASCMYSASPSPFSAKTR